MACPSQRVAVVLLYCLGQVSVAFRFSVGLHLSPTTLFYIAATHSTYFFNSLTHLSGLRLLPFVLPKRIMTNHSLAIFLMQPAC
jgi:hypothetical protein